MDQEKIYCICGVFKELVRDQRRGVEEGMKWSGEDGIRCQ